MRRQTGSSLFCAMFSSINLFRLMLQCLGQQRLVDATLVILCPIRSGLGEACTTWKGPFLAVKQAVIAGFGS